MKGKYIKHRPASTKQKGGNPSYFKPDYTVSSPCISLKDGKEIDSGGKYFDEAGKVRRKRKSKGTHYVRRISNQVIKTLDGDIVYGTVSLLETTKGSQYWIARREETEWDDEQCVDVCSLVGKSFTVDRLNGSTGCWVEIEIEEPVVASPENVAIKRLGGLFK